jgi:hypothetical protein
VPVTIFLFDAPQENTAFGENPAPNGAPMTPQSSSEDHPKKDSRTDSEVDSGEHSPACPDSYAPDPKEDLVLSSDPASDASDPEAVTSSARVGAAPAQQGAAMSPLSAVLSPSVPTAPSSLVQPAATSSPTRAHVCAPAANPTGSLICLKCTYNFLCSMLVFTPFA